MNIVVDEELHSLIPPLSDEEYAQLENNLLAYGCRDALVVWGNAGELPILLDGHNRKEICEKHNITFKVKAIELPDRDAAMSWIEENQLGRRNLNPEAVSYLRGRLYNRRKKTKSEAGAMKSKSKGQNVPSLTTAETMASEHGITARTIKRDGQLAAEVDKLEQVAPGLRRDVLSGKGPTRRQIRQASKILGLGKDITKTKQAAQVLSTQKTPQLYSSTSFGWLTPPTIIERVIKVLGVIDLDPCSDNAENPNVPCRRSFTRKDDGLSQKWRGNVYMNPPYGRELPKWIEKLLSEFSCGNIKEAI